MTESTSTVKKPTFIAYQVTENKSSDAQSKGFWNRIGAAWKNRDDSITIQLDCLPIDGRIVLQIPKEKKEDASQAA